VFGAPFGGISFGEIWRLASGGTSSGAVSTAGTGSASFVGASRHASIWSAAGLGTFTPSNGVVSASVWSVSGAAAFSGVGNTIGTAIWASSGLGTVTGVARATAASIWFSAGVASVTWTSGGALAFILDMNTRLRELFDSTYTRDSIDNSTGYTTYEAGLSGDANNRHKQIVDDATP